MKYYSTNRKAPLATLEEAVKRGLAPDRGLYMPERIVRLPEEFFRDMGEMDFHEIAFAAASAFFGEDIPSGDLKDIVCDTLNFDTPVVNIHDNIWALELYHGPTLAFKDVGGRFMARMLSYFVRQEKTDRKTTVIVATSGDTGSAVANGFLGVEGIDVIVLYPSGKVSEIQEKQFTTLGQNITALEVDGNFDDCQRLVKSAFMDEDLGRTMTLTSANSINVARFLPQAFYYFNAYAQLKRAGHDSNIVFCVPSGNFGNITAGLFAWRMGLPVRRFIAANNRNDVFLEYLKTGEYTPRASVRTIANAMDVGDPSNFARILDLYGNSATLIRQDIAGCRYTDEEIGRTISSLYDKYGYLADPHGACGYQGLTDLLSDGETGIFLETAHPAKFKDTVEKIIGKPVEIPERLKDFMKKEKKSIKMTNRFEDFKEYLESRR
ncbi:MAG TPA: threonine synthase [Candidatus Cryptobacteroides intestinipullorum]|nr:threonine synthase [Candidatus Cryptobacteroides intestinipullorum]